MGKDYYGILGINKDASEEDIKKAYKKAALKHHPDRNKGSETSAAKFKDASEAFEVLSDSNKRAVFDQFGEEGLKAGPPPSGGAGGAPFGAGAGANPFASFIFLVVPEKRSSSEHANGLVISEAGSSVSDWEERRARRGMPPGMLDPMSSSSKSMAEDGKPPRPPPMPPPPMPPPPMPPPPMPPNSCAKMSLGSDA